MKHARIPLVAATLLLLALTATASAGTFTLHSCQTPSGTFVGDEGWVALPSTSTPDRDSGVIETCTSAGRAMGARFGGVQLPVESGVGRTWRFNAAPHTAVSNAAITRSFELAWLLEDGLYGRGYVADFWHDEDEVSNRLEFRAAPWGGRIDSSRAGAQVVGSAGSWEAVSFRLRCWETNGDGLCAPFRAVLQVSRATFVIDDAHAPTGNADVGALTGPVRGSAAIGVSASDVGGGVYRAVVSVDGQVLVRTVLDSNGGACGDVEPGNGDAYEFAVPRPCPLDASGDVTLDTRGLVDGQHQLRVEVEDAAGNATLLHEGAFTTRNAPVATAVPSISAGTAPRVGDVLLGLGGSWDGALGEPALRWLRCDAAGDGCAAISGAIGGIYAVTPADLGGRLVLEERTGNANGEGMARSQPTAVVAEKLAGPTDPEPNPQGGGTPPPDPPAPGGRGGGTGGVDGLHNPVADQGGRSPNGEGASGQAKLTLRLRLDGGGTATRARGRHSRRWTVTGRLVDPAGRPIADARVNLVGRIGAGRWKADGVVRTGADGRFSRTLAAGPSRQLRATYFPFADSRSFRSSGVVAIESLAPLTIRADRTRVAGGGAVALSGRAGRAGGARIPRGGLLIALQGHQAGYGWRTFRTVRTNAAGRWKASYRFRSRAGRFAFRAVVPRQNGYPFAATTSAAVTVRVG